MVRSNGSTTQSEPSKISAAAHSYARFFISPNKKKVPGGKYFYVAMHASNSLETNENKNDENSVGGLFFLLDKSDNSHFVMKKNRQINRNTSNYKKRTFIRLSSEALRMLSCQPSISICPCV